MSLVFRETRLETKFKFTRKVVFDDERGRWYVSLPLLVLKLLRFLNRFCSSFFSSSLLSSSVLLLLLRVVVGVFPSAFSFAVSLPSQRTNVCISVLRSRNTKAREEKSLSKILSSSVKLSLRSFPSRQQQKGVLSLSLLFARANASAVFTQQSPNRQGTPLIPRNPVI